MFSRLMSLFAPSYTESSSSSSNSLGVKFNEKVRQSKITMGQGEYIVFKVSSEGERTIALDLFQHIYPLLNSYSPLVLASDENRGLETCLNRYTFLKSRIKEVDDQLEIVFIPRTLYDLILLKSSIEEDVLASDLCPLLDPPSRMHIEQKKLKLNRECWHLPFHAQEESEKAANIEIVAHRLNNLIIRLLNPSEEGFTGSQLLEFTENQISFFQEHYNSQKIKCSWKAHFHSPTVNFQTGGDRSGSQIFPMGLQDEEDVQIVKSALLFDCSETAASSFFIYRGASLEDDGCTKIMRQNKEVKRLFYSLSYGTSLFAGAIYDGGATAFHYMRKKNNSAYAIAVSFAELKNSIFHIPAQNAVAQMFGYGESFHARTKLPASIDMSSSILGIENQMKPEDKQKLISEKTEEEIVTEFEGHKQKAIILKKESNKSRHA